MGSEPNATTSDESVDADVAPPAADVRATARSLSGLDDVDDDEAVAIAVAVAAHLRDREVAAAAAAADEGAPERRDAWAFAGRLESIRGLTGRVSERAPRNAWSAAGRVERF